jgi:Domain of unknown function (DUF4129)
MKEREQPSWFDFSVAAISPVLIMGLVGSLAFFLLDVLYGGQYAERLYWTLFFFVVGAVLVARIAIVVDPGRAKLYGLALGAVVFLAMLKFVDFLPSSSLSAVGWLINLVIILIVLWASNKLVWNCTFLDEKDPDPGRGLLVEAVVSPRLESPRRALPSQTQVAAKRTTPGLSVIYFTLAAFPLFGLGQSLIPLAETGRRRWAFVLMTIYVACGLGLLLTTTLLGLRRYLRQRRLTMPAQMTGLWLGVGGILIVLLLLVGGFFPRPHAEYPLISMTRVGSEDRDASRAGQGDQPGKGEGRGGAKGEGDAQEGSGKGNEGGKAKGESGKPEGGSGGDKGAGAKSGPQGDKGGGNQDKRESDSGNDRLRPNTEGMSDAITKAVKWAVLVMLGIPLLVIVTIFLMRRMEFLPDWLKKWLDALAAWWRSLFNRQVEPEPEIEPAEVVRRPSPFRSFSNPFADGSAAHRSPDELVRYSFAALDAWASEHDLARHDEETPFEFVQRLSVDVPDLADASRRLSTYYANLAYGRRHVPESARPQIEQLWLGLDAAQVVSPREDEP